MKEKVICGIQQVGIGVEELIAPWKWYHTVLGFEMKIFDDEGVATYKKNNDNATENDASERDGDGDGDGKAFVDFQHGGILSWGIGFVFLGYHKF